MGVLLGGITMSIDKLKTLAQTALFVVLAIGMWRVLDASANYIMSADAMTGQVDGILVEYRTAVGDVGEKLSSMMDAQIEVVGAIEQSVSASTSLIEQSKSRITWAAEMSENLFPAEAQANIGEMLRMAVSALTNAINYLVNNPNDVHGALEGLFTAWREAAPMNTAVQDISAAVDGWMGTTIEQVDALNE